MNTAIKILLVDDEKPFVDTMTKRLKKREIEVIPAHDGLEAIILLGGEQGCRSGHSGY